MPGTLPLDPPLDLGPQLLATQQRVERALLRLDERCRLLQDPQLLLFFLVRKEAVLSSQIEGTQSSLEDLLLIDRQPANESQLRLLPRTPDGELRADATAVAGYVAAVEHGIERIAEGFPLSNRLLREMHARLLSREFTRRGAHQAPGEFRRSQNWIGGSRPRLAAFVPPPPHQVENLMTNLERYLHTPGIPPMVRAGVAHVQFETIHPFLDGNGRIGRMLIVLLLLDNNPTGDGLLHLPLLYPSLFFKERRRDYYDRLDLVRSEGDFEGWLRFFFEGIATAADDTASTIERAEALRREHLESVDSLGRARHNARRLLEWMARQPVATAAQVADALDVSRPTATKALERLVDLRHVEEITGKKRDRVWAYSSWLRLLAEDTDSPL